MVPKLLIAGGMFTLARILCPVDFSAGSRHALDYACALARSFQARIGVLYVHCMPVPVPVAGYPELAQPLLLTDVQRGDIVQHLSEFVAVDRGSGVSIDAVFEEALSVAPAIVETAVQDGTDLIVMGTHGRAGFNRLVLGSVANRVMKTAACPVMIVPPRAADTVPVAFHRIVAACDFSAASTRALEVSAVIASTTGARLTAVHVLDLPGELSEHRHPAFDGYRSSRFDEARASLVAAVVAGAPHACAVDELIVVGKPYVEILRMTAEQQADLLVIGTQGRGALDPVMFGTTTHRVVRQASCPVLVVRASAAR